jgi:hypothetical protein
MKGMEDRRAGLSLIEVTLYTTLLALVGAPLVTMALASARATTENDVFNKVEERNRTALYRVERELRRGLSGTAVVSDFGRTLAFTSAAGFDGTASIPGPQVTFRFVIANGETANGLDDNGNGVADEGQLERSDTTGASHIVCGDIDLASSGFAMNGLGVTITAATFGSLRGADTFSLAKTMTVYPRN